MATVSIILNSLAFVLLLVMVGLFGSEIPRRGNHGEWTITVTLVLLPMWLLLASGMAMLVSRQGFAWLGGGSARQYVIVLSGCLALFVVSWFTAALGLEPATDIPWAIKPFLPWPHFVFPILVLLYSYFAWNGPVPMAVRVPLAALTAFALLLCAGLVFELIAEIQKSQTAKLQGVVDDANRRDAIMLAEVEALDPEKDFGRLLNFTIEFESPPIRALALKKVLSRPDVKADIAAAIKKGYAAEALRFFQSNSVPDQNVIAESVRDAIVAEAAGLRGRMRTANTIYASDEDSRVAQCLKIADKFRSSAVNFAPAIQTYRDAFDEPRSDVVDPAAKRTLNAWLARNGGSNPK